MSLLWIAVAVLAALVVPVLFSLVVEALRRVPQAPARLSWAPDIAIRYADVGGMKLRYVKAGAGPDLLLLHTLRTQLDLFEKMVSDLAKNFTVYALDYPGHGFSDIPPARYDAISSSMRSKASSMHSTCAPYPCAVSRSAGPLR
jgi:alpha-beta hydrolase superfamily lysophospholipase